MASTPKRRPIRLLVFQNTTGKQRMQVWADDAGHVTVECHCPRCEAERQASWREAARRIPPELYEKYCSEDEQPRDEAAQGAQA